MKNVSLYLLTIWEDVESELEGPFPTDTERLVAAQAFRQEHEGGVFRLNVEWDNKIVTVGDFTNGEVSSGSEPEPEDGDIDDEWDNDDAEEWDDEKENEVV